LPPRYDRSFFRRAARRRAAIPQRGGNRTKFGFKIDPETGKQIGMDSRPEHIKQVAGASLTRLKTDVIDLLYQHRVDPDLPIEDMAGAVKDQSAYRSRACNGPTRRHPVQSVRALQNEYSLWTRGPETRGILQVCEEFGIGLVPYSPLGRGFLAGAATKDTKIEKSDFRSMPPRFTPEAMEANQALVNLLKRINSTFQELIPSRYRGHIDLMTNGASGWARRSAPWSRSRCSIPR
jgi:aryl-alcohol dehydrogenase-like predicted oxidoreductase